MQTLVMSIERLSSKPPPAPRRIVSKEGSERDTDITSKAQAGNSNQNNNNATQIPTKLEPAKCEKSRYLIESNDPHDNGQLSKSSVDTSEKWENASEAIKATNCSSNKESQVVSEIYSRKHLEVDTVKDVKCNEIEGNIRKETKPKSNALYEKNFNANNNNTTSLKTTSDETRRIAVKGKVVSGDKDNIRNSTNESTSSNLTADEFYLKIIGKDRDTATCELDYSNYRSLLACAKWTEEAAYRLLQEQDYSVLCSK